MDDHYRSWWWWWRWMNFFFAFLSDPFFLTPTFITVYAWRISAFASWWCRLPPTVSSTTAITLETKTSCALVRIYYAPTPTLCSWFHFRDCNDPEIQPESLFFSLENPLLPLSRYYMFRILCRVIIRVFLSISFFSIPWCFFLSPLLLLDKRKYPP